ncbi:MAG: hypothetical protein LUQ27_05700 [Methanomassiliicoccales archaeon]|nr:hypothetical protein [Methanomassiliicoccales archaeon]
MSKTVASVSAVILASLFLFSGLAGITSAASGNDPLDRIAIEQGNSSAFGGSRYVAVNMTRGDSAAWFGVLYGTEENPAPITLVGAYVRYLGGAEVRDQNGGMMIPAIPIPVVTVFAQCLGAMIEFNDTGYAFDGERVGAENGLYDFIGDRSLGNFSMITMEPVYKLVNLSRAWELSDVEETVDEAIQTKYLEFSLSAENIVYDRIWDNEPAEFADGGRNGNEEDGVIENVQFTFHVEASAGSVTAEVPWYKIRIDGDNDIISSEAAGTKVYSGVSVNAAFKYDHLIQGWDYTAKSNNSKLMLENLVFFGTFIPDKVQEWFDSQFVRDQMVDGTGVAAYDTAEGQQEVRTSDEVPKESEKVAKNRIEFRDNWERCGLLTWVSDVTVDGEEDQMYYQVHAGQARDFRGENDDGEVRSVAILGGYIYPAGSDIYHDPTFEASTFMLSMAPDFGGLFAFAIVIGTTACGSSVLAFVLLRSRSKKGKIQYRIPPEYRGR